MRTTIIRHALAVAAVVAAAVVAWRPAHAHGVAMSQLRLEIEGGRVTGEWEINLDDARRVVGLDPAVIGEAGWAGLRPHEAEVRAYLADRLGLDGDGRACPFEILPAPMAWQPELGQVMFHVAATCAAAPTRLAIHCELLFDLDPRHRAYFSVEDARVTSAGVFRTNLRSVTIDVRQFHAWETSVEFAREGIGHIASGLDHMLFLVALLLPASLVRTRDGWSPRTGLWATIVEATKVVTAFTAAHSITLSLAFFGHLSPRAQWVEVGIALSVFAAAWNNLRPFLPGRAWAMAFAFGLVHGLGFAGALNNLSLPRHARVLALGAFNVGVELGQLAIVAVALPLLYAASRRRAYPRLVMGVGSFAIAWVAVVWILERGFGLSFFAKS